MKKKYQLRITFKNVGQGDCIFVEWRNAIGVMEVGIIDCNLSGNIKPNRIFDRLEKYSYLSFLVLSHPHTDHFSGLHTLLDYCEQNNIKIRQIIHTAVFNDKSLKVQIQKDSIKTFIDSFVKNDKTRYSPQTDLQRLFIRFQRLHKDKRLPTEEASVTNDFLLDLDTPGLKFKFLSPSFRDEHADYARSVFEQEDDTIYIGANNPNANLLSSVLLIQSEKWQVLLTSDVRKQSLKRILEKYGELLCSPERPIIIAQVPHHGSGNEHETHYPKFWDHCLNKEHTSVFISSGFSNFCHPRKEVVAYFHQNAKKVYATNNVHGYREFYDDEYVQQEEIMWALDWVSGSFETSSNLSECGEQQISIKYDGTYKVRTR